MRCIYEIQAYDNTHLVEMQQKRKPVGDFLFCGVFKSSKLINREFQNELHHFISLQVNISTYF